MARTAKKKFEELQKEKPWYCAADREYLPFKAFYQIYCVQQGWGRITEFDERVCDWMESSIEDEYRLLMAYRDSGKSTKLSNYLAWRIYLDPMYTSVILSATEALASRNAKHIRAIIETHPLTQELVPKGDETWQSRSFTVKRPRIDLRPTCKTASITGGGRTGWHAHEIVVDDIEIDLNCKTEEARDKLKEIVYELVSMSENLFFVGTPHHEDTIYNFLYYEQAYNRLRIPVWDEDPENPGNMIPAQPERHDLKWCLNKKARLSTPKWESQFLLIPRAAYEVQIDPALLRPYEDTLTVDYDAPPDKRTRKQQPEFYLNRERIMDIRAYWDPASGLRNRDHSVLSICGRTDKRNVYLIHIETLPPIDFESLERFRPQMERILQVLKKYHCNNVCVEKNFSMTLATELKLFAEKQGSRVVVRETTRKASQKKQEFIADQLEPLISGGRFWVPRWVYEKSKFRNELQSFPNSKHDDHLDATAGAIAELAVGHKPYKGDPLVKETPKQQRGFVKANRYRPFQNL